jgi:diacylglycerol kinase (ATP)
MEAIIGVQVRRRETMSPRSISEEFSSGDTRYRESEDYPHTREKGKEKEDRDEEIIKVYDGNGSFRRHIFRLISVSRQSTTEELLIAALREFHITKDLGSFYLTDIYATEVSRLGEVCVADPLPVMSLHCKEGRRPAVFLRFRDCDNDSGEVRVYPGKLQVSEAYCTIPVNGVTTTADLIQEALICFGLEDFKCEDYRLSEVLLDRGVTERVLSWNEHPWEIVKQRGKESIRQMELMRFYMQQKQDPHGPNLALFVGNLPPNLSQRKYENMLTEFLGNG